MEGHLHLKWLPPGKLKLAPSVPFLESGQALQIKKDRRKHGRRDKGRCLRCVRRRVKCRNENPNWYVGRPNPCPRGHRRRHGVKRSFKPRWHSFFFRIQRSRATESSLWMLIVKIHVALLRSCPRVSPRWFSPAYATKAGFEVPRGAAKEAVSTSSTPPPPQRSGVQEGKQTGTERGKEGGKRGMSQRGFGGGGTRGGHLVPVRLFCF